MPNHMPKYVYEIVQRDEGSKSPEVQEKIRRCIDQILKSEIDVAFTESTRYPGKLFMNTKFLKQLEIPDDQEHYNEFVLQLFKSGIAGSREDASLMIDITLDYIAKGTRLPRDL